MKKLFSLVLVFALVLSLGVTAFAEEAVPEVFEAELNEQEAPEEMGLLGKGGGHKDGDQDSIKIGKWLKSSFLDIKTPSQTFNFKVEKHAVSNSSVTLAEMPEIGDFQITTPPGILGSYATHNLPLPNFTKPGVYQYKITEDGGNEAGVEYDERELILTIYVTNGSKGKLNRHATLHDLNGKNDMKKVEWFKNDFGSSGFYVNKKVEGNMGDRDQEFTIIVEFDAGGKNVSGQGWYGQGVFGLNRQYFNFVDGKATVEITLKHNQTVLFGNIPLGVSYTVSEEDYDNYEAEITNGSGIVKRLNKTVYIVNENEQIIETGINLDNLPYILVLGAATIGLVGFTARKRFSKDDY